MKKIKLLLLLFMILTIVSYAQIQRTPFTLSTEWRFGNKAGLSFPISGIVNSTLPALNPGNQSPESSISICDTQNNIAVFTDTRIVYNNTTGIIRNIETTDNIAGGSSTEGGVLIPDPLDPINKYYLFIANDISGGTKQYKGINYYKITRVAGVTTYSTGPFQLIGTIPLNLANSAVDESLTSSPDGLGNYFIISKSNSAATFYVWKVTNIGISLKTDYPVLNTPASSTAQSSIKVNLCQNKIAWNGAGVIRVYNFNNTTGAISNTPIYKNAGGADFLFNKSPYEIEFSADGSKLYTASQNWSQLALTDLNGSAGNGVSISTNEMWGLQLGPNGNIYASGTPGSSTIYEVTNANTSSPTINTLTLQTGTKIYRGISNISFLNPNQPVITDSSMFMSGGCKKFYFNYKFRTYFNDTITTAYNSEIWDFGDGTSTVKGHSAIHTFPSTGPYLVKMTTIDSTCHKTWTDTIYVSPNCPLPVDFVSIKGTNYGNHSIISWVVARSVNGKYFEVRRSLDGKNFNVIGKVNLNNTNYYNYVDYDLFNGVVYYDVIQVDKDESITKSAIVSVVEGNNEIIIEPNPFIDQLNIRSVTEFDIKILFYDVSGKFLFDSYLKSNETIDVGGSLKSGVYILSWVINNHEYFKKVIKK